MRATAEPADNRSPAWVGRYSSPCQHLWLDWRLLIALLALASLAVWVRQANTRWLPPEQFFDGDSVRFYRQASLLVKQGSLPAIDADRWFPDGRDLTRYCAVSSYALAGFYRLGHLLSRTLTLPEAALWYPVVCFLPGLGLLYWLCRRVVSEACALLSVTLYALLPIGIHHSVVGYCDRDSLVLLLSMLAVGLRLASMEAERAFLQLLLSGGAALVMVLLAHTWEGAGLLASVVVVGYLLQALLRGSSRRSALSQALWCTLVLAGLPLFDRVYLPPLQAYSALAWLVPLCGLAWAAFDLFWVHGRSMPPSPLMRLGSFAGAAGAAVVLAALVWAQAPGSLLEHLTMPLGHNRLMSTVGELQKPTLPQWYDALGMVGWLSVVGAVSLSQQLAGGSRWRWVAGVSTLSFVFFGAVVPAWLSGGRSPIADSLFLVSLGIWSLGWFLVLFGYRRRAGQAAAAGPAVPPTSAACLVPQDGGSSALLLSWFLLALAAARSSVRFELFLLPVACVLAALVLDEVGRELLGAGAADLAFRLATLALGVGAAATLTAGRLISPVGLAVILVGLATPLFGLAALRPKAKLLLELAWPVLFVVSAYQMGGGLAAHGSAELAGVSTGQFARLTGPLRWLRTHAPNSVVAAWWDYGSWINAFGNCRTVIDEDHYHPYWIHLFAREVLLGGGGPEALRFLYAHGAGYLMVTRDDIGRLPAIAYIGIRPSSGSLPDLRALPLARETLLHNGHHLYTTPEGLALAFRPAGLVGRRVRLTGASLELDLTHKRVIAARVREAQGRDLVPRFVQVENVRQATPKPNTDLGVVCQSVPVAHLPKSGVSREASPHSRPRRSAKVMYVLSAEQQRTLAVRLFLLREHVPGLTSVYYDGWSGIWRVERVPGIEPDPASLLPDFPPGKAKDHWASVR